MLHRFLPSKHLTYYAINARRWTLALAKSKRRIANQRSGQYYSATDDPGITYSNFTLITHSRQSGRVFSVQQPVRRRYRTERGWEVAWPVTFHRTVGCGTQRGTSYQGCRSREPGKSTVLVFECTACRTPVAKGVVQQFSQSRCIRHVFLICLTVKTWQLSISNVQYLN